MNQEKMGKLIASLRKKKNLTQSELGAMVGVGDRAVSKWERGITCPDISIINDLSKALGITSDELLAGELNDKELMNELTQSANIFSNWLIFLPIVLVLAFVGMLLYFNYNRDDVYRIKSISDECDVSGKIVFNGNRMSIIITNVVYDDDDFKATSIKNYEYNIKSENDFLFRIGDIDKHFLLINKMTIGELCENININHDINIQINKRKVIDQGIILTIVFFDANDHYITSTIKISLYK